MEIREFEIMHDCLIKEEKKLLKFKGEEYSGESNTFKNFEDVAERLNMHPIHVLMVYYSKHNDSIFNYTKSFEVLSNEDITGRIMDARNYLAMLFAMIHKYRALEKDHKWNIP